MLESMRSIGYDDEIAAIQDLLDNSAEAGSSNAYVLFSEEGGKQKEVMGKLPFVMTVTEWIKKCFVLLPGSEFKQAFKQIRSWSIWFGLPSASISVARIYSVYSKTAEGEWHHIQFNLDEWSDEVSKSGLLHLQKRLRPRRGW